MAEAVDLDLLASTVASSAGASTAVEIDGRQNAAQLVVDVTAISGSLVVNVERRPDASAPWETTNTITISATGAHKLSALVGPLTRVSYTPTATATFAVAGSAETVYCVPADITEDIVRDAALSELSTTRLVNACLRASDEADGWLRSRYTMPITAWTRDLRMHTAELAAAYLFTFRGTDPDSPDMLVYDARNTASRWFDRLQAGRIEPNITDSSSPAAYGAGAVVASNPRRGW